MAGGGVRTVNSPVALTVPKALLISTVYWPEAESCTLARLKVAEVWPTRVTLLNFHW